MFKKTKRKFLKNKITYLISGTALMSASIFALTSCGAIDQNLINSSIKKGDGKFFASNESLNSFSKEALLNSAGQIGYLNGVSNQLAFDWLEKAGTIFGQTDYQNRLERQIKVIDDEYKKLVEDSKKEYGNNFDLLFQQNVLDLNGGTEQSWKNKKLTEWARSNIQDQIFENDFLAVKNATGVVASPTASDIKNAISKSSGFYFGFSEDAILFADPIKKPIYKKYAKFQEFIFNKWVELENPFIINNVSWKYDTPTGGINSIYYADQESSGDSGDGSSDATTSSGSYKYPYFAIENLSNDNPNASQKFINFITDAATTANYITDTTLGLRTIDSKYSQDSSTLMMLKNSSSFSEQPIELAAASSYQLYKVNSGTPTYPAISNIDADLQKTILTTSIQGVDPILSNFISSNSINNLDIKLSQALLKNIIKSTGQYSQLLTNANLYVADLIKSNNANLSNFIFARTVNGVNAIAIEGQTFLNTASTLSDFKNNAAAIVQYYNLMYKNGFTNFSININAELKSFFSNNFDWLVYEYANDTSLSEQERIFDLSIFSTEQKAFNLALSNFIKENSYGFKASDYQKRMFEAKKTYSENYGLNAYKNGFATPWAYSYQTNSTNFEVVKTVTNFDPFAASGTYNTFVSAIDTFINSLNLLPQESSFAGYKYSQYIYTNNNLINLALISFGNDGESMGQVLKLKTLINQSSSYFDSTNLEFSTVTDVTGFTGAKDALNLGLNNFFFNSYFANAENHWNLFNEMPSANNTISLSKLNSYRKDLWKTNAIDSHRGLQQFYSLYSLIVTANYLLENDGRQFLNYLQEKIIYGLDSYIVWTEGQNTYLNPTSKNVSTLLEVADTSLSMNINNNFKSNYFGTKPSDTIDIINNTENSNPLFTSSSYYQYVSNTVGFQGLKSTNTSDLPIPIQERLFTDVKKNSSNKGLLYAYESLDKLIALVNSFNNLTDLETLANSLQKKLISLSLSQFSLANSLSTKKAALIAELSKTTVVTSEMFEPRTGYISQGDLSTSTGALIIDESQTNLSYGAKAIHLNASNVTSLNDLLTTINKLTGVNASQVFYNLVIQAANDLNLQTKVLNQIAISNRINVYDIRLETQLGYDWIRK